MRIILKKQVEKFIDKQPENIQKAIRRDLDILKKLDSFNQYRMTSLNIKKLIGENYEHRQLYRLKSHKQIRLIFYETEDGICLIFNKAGNRGDIYKK